MSFWEFYQKYGPFPQKNAHMHTHNPAYNCREDLGSAAHLQHPVNSAHSLLTSPRLLEWTEIIFHHKILHIFRAALSYT